MLNWEIFLEKLKYKKIAVFGLGKSGLSTVRACVDNGLGVCVWDDSESQCNAAKALGAEILDLVTADLSGFDYIILAPGIHYTYEPHPVVVNAQKHNLKIIGDIELLHKVGIPCKTIGITGTNGKSTTTALMTHILNENDTHAVMAGNIGIPVFDIDFSERIDFLVLELSSYQLDLCPDFRPDYSMLLNISSDHLDRHGSMEEYVNSKSKILEGEGFAVIDIDDDFTQVLFDKNFIEGKRKYIPVSVHHEIPEGYFVRNSILYQNKQGQTQALGSLKDLATLKGAHNFQNILCAYVVSKEIGLVDHGIFDALKSFSGLPHRQYLVCQKDNISFVNDSKATNAEAAAKALSSYEDIYWIVGGQPKENGLQGLEIFKDKIVKTYLIGEATEAFSQWFDTHNFIYEAFDNLEAATKRAYVEAKQFDANATVLLSPACASWDQFGSFEERGNNFSEIIKKITA